MLDLGMNTRKTRSGQLKLQFFTGSKPVRRALLVLGVALVVIGLALQLFQGDGEPLETPATADQRSLRQTSSGPVVGFAGPGDTFSWLGIPYAAAPNGQRRWRAPVPPEPWSEAREALVHGHVCPQFGSVFGGISEDQQGQLVGNEDCLTLDIYAPQEVDPSQPLPVMFWIHGGGNTIGTGRSYDGSALASEQQVLVVNINYRLGVLGWLSHPALRTTASDAFEASGNFSNLDMVLALDWVQDNIAAFGGDPDRVTIFGESAGGRNVFALLASPTASGLFHGAIAQSGLAGTTTLQRAENYRDDPNPGAGLSSRELVLTWLQQTGRAASREAARALQDSLSAQEMAAFLRSLTVEQMFAALETPGGMYPAPQHFRDGTVLPKQSLLSVFADPQGWNRVPLITGTNRDEMKLFLALSDEYVSQWLGVIPRVRDPETYNWLSAYLSDRWKALAVDEVSEAISGSGVQEPVYGYRFDWDEGTSNWLVDLPLLLGSPHAVELDFIWGPILGRFVSGLYTEENKPGRDYLMHAMRGYWGQFARTGDPGTGTDGDLSNWQPWQAGEGGFMVIDTPRDGGLRMTTDGVSAADLKARLRADDRLSEPSTRCAMYVTLFLDNGGAEDFFDTREYQELDCAEFPPWSLADRTR